MKLNSNKTTRNSTNKYIHSPFFLGYSIAVPDNICTRAA